MILRSHTSGRQWCKIIIRITRTTQLGATQRWRLCLCQNHQAQHPPPHRPQHPHMLLTGSITAKRVLSWVASSPALLFYSLSSSWLSASCDTDGTVERVVLCLPGRTLTKCRTSRNTRWRHLLRKQEPKTPWSCPPQNQMWPTRSSGNRRRDG